LTVVNVLVTGGAGFIGSNFVRYWVEHHPADAVVAYDALTYAGNRPNLAEVEDRISFFHGDVCDLELACSVLESHDIDTVVHFAAESHNSLAVLDPARFFRTNVIGTQVMLEAARRAGVARFHHISTCEVYGDLALDVDEAFTEDSPYRPRTPYNASKAGADHAVRAYVETYGLAATITNCSNNYGPYQFPEKVIPLFAANALDDRPLPLYASTHNRREWLHVDDHCRAIEVVLERGRVGETYHVGSGVEASIEEIADAVLAVLGKPASLRPSSRIAPATIAATCSTAPRSPRSSTGRPLCPSTRAWLTRCGGTPPIANGGSRCATGPRWSRRRGAPIPPMRPFRARATPMKPMTPMKPRP
jgi:dTDP-glucose 4,6-dehydratase